MKIIVLGVLLFLSAFSSVAYAKATKDSTVVALQVWERCIGEKVALEIDIEKEEALVPPGTPPPESLLALKRAVLLKTGECAKLYQEVQSEHTRYLLGQ